MFQTPPRTTKPSPLSYLSPTSPTKQFRQGSTQYTVQSSPKAPTAQNGSSNTLSSPFIAQNQRKPSPSGMNQLSQPQIRELRESFQVLDKDGDGVINKDDLGAMLSSIGIEPNPALLSQYFSHVPSPFTLASYLTTLTTHLAELSPRDDILSAFAAFDEGDDGVVNLDLLKDALQDMGMRPDDVEKACRGWTNKKGLGMGGDKFRYREFVDTVCGKAAVEE